MGIETALEIPAGEGSKFPSSFSFDMTAGARTQRHWEQREPTDNAGLQAVEQTAPQAGTVEDQRQALKRCTKAPGRNPLQDDPEEGPENTLQTTKLPSKEIAEDSLAKMKECTKMEIKKRKQRSNPKNMSKELLQCTLPAYLESAVQPLLRGIVEKLQLMRSGQERLDDSLHKRAQETVEAVQHSLRERISQMNSEEQLYYAYMIRSFSMRLVGYHGSPEQLQSSVAVPGLVALLLSIGLSPEDGLYRNIVDNDGFFVVVPVFRAMVCEGRVSVPPRNPTVTEAFQQIDSLNSHQSWYQHFLECFEQTALVKNTSAAFDDPPFETDYVQDQVYSSRKTTFTTLNEERSGVNNSSTLVGKDSTTGDIGDEKGKHPTHSRLCININGAHTIPSSVTERFTRFLNISHNDSHVEGFYNIELSEAVAVALAVFLKQDFSSFSQKIMLLNGRDGSKSTALPEVDLTRDVYVESATGYECRSFDSQVTRATTIEKGVLVVKKAVEMKDMEKVKERAVPKVPFNNQTNAVSLASEGYSEDHGRNVVANASSELQPVASAFSEPQPVASAFSEPQPVASAFSEPQPLLTCPPAPKLQPPPPTVWCWKRRLESLTNVHVFIGNAGPVALEELDTECQETICHAVACVRDEDAVSLIHTLCNNNISPRLFCMQDKLGNTPLHNAVLHDNIMVAKELVGLDPSAISIRNCEHVTPLDIAVSKMNDEMVSCLLEKCVLSDPHGTSSVVLLQSCLLKAMKTGHIYYLETLLKLHSAHGLAIDFECADGDGYTAWHHLKQKVPDARAAAIKLLKDSGLSEKLRRKLLKMLNADSCLDFSAEGPAAVPTAREIDSLQSVEDTDSPEERCAAAIDTSQSQSEQSMYSDEEKTSLNTVLNTECKSTTGIEMDVFDTSSDGGTLQSSPLHREHENDNPTILAPELYDAVSATDFGSDTVTEELNKEDASTEEPPHKGQMSLPCQGEKLVVSDNEIKPICVFHPYTSLQTSSIVSPLWRMRQKLKKAEVQKGKTVCYTRKNTSTFVSAIWTNRYHNPYLETRMLGKGLWFDLSCQQLNSQCHDTSLYGTTASTHNSVLPHSKASPPCYPAKERIEKEWTYAQPTQWSILTRQYTSGDRDFDSNKMPETKRNVHVPGYSPTRYTISSSMARYYFPLVAKAMLCSFAFKHSFVNNRNIAIHIKSAGTHVRRKTKFHCLESEVVNFNFKKHSFSPSRPVHLLHIDVELWVDDSADKSSKELCRTSESTVPWKVKSQNSTKPDPRFLPDQIQKYGCQSFDTSICTSSAEPEEQTYTFTDEPGLDFAPILLDSAFEELPISDTQEAIDIREGMVQNGSPTSNANVAASNTEPQEQQTDTCTDELFSLTLDSPCDPIPDTQEAIDITEEDIDENPEPCYDPKQISEFPSSIQPPPLAVTVSPVQESVDNTSPAQENNSLSEDAVEESRPELLERFKLEPNSHCESASFSSSKTSTNCSTDSQGCTSAKDTQQSDLPSSELPLRQKHSASGNRQRAESRILKCRCSSSESSQSDSKEQSNDPTRGKKKYIPPSKSATLKPLIQSQEKKQCVNDSEVDGAGTPVHAVTYSPSVDGSTKLCTSNITNSQPPDDTEVDGFTTPPTETPPSISYGSARPSAAETTTTISPQCREEESSGLSVLEFTNSSNPLDVIHSHMKVYPKCCPRHDIRSVVIGTTYPPSDAFGPKRRYSSIKDIHSDPSHSQFDCTKKLSAQSSSNRHYRDSESQQIMFERPSPESVLRQNRGSLPPKLHSPSLVQSLMETTESHPSPPLSSRQQTSQLHHPTENLAQGRSKNSEAAVVTVANREASAENPESTRRLENARSSIQSRQSTSFLDSQTVSRDHKERIRGTAELLHAQDYTRILPLAYEGDPPDSLPPLLKIPFVFITGLAYYKLSNHKKSVQFFTKCLALADDCGRDGDITICNIYIGDIDFAKRRYSEAAGRYQTALQHYSRESVAQDFRMVMPTRSAVWLKCGSALKNASRVGDSVAAYEKAIEIAASKKDQLSAHTSLGNLYQGIGENGRAVKEYEAAIELAQDLEDNVFLGWNHGNLGNALLGLHQRDKALHHLFKALDMAVEFETTPQAIGRAYNNLGTAFQSLNELAKAEEHYDLALAQAIYGNDIPGQARVYGNIGNLQMLNKLYDRAVPHYTEVMRLSQDKATITTAHHNRGCAYYDWAEKKKTAVMPKGPTSGGRNSSAQEPRGPTRSSVPHAGRSSAPRSIATRGREVEIKGQQSSRHLTVSDSDSSSDDEPRTTESCFRVSLHGPDFERCEDILRPHIVTPAIQKYYLQGTRDLEYVIKHHEENFSGIKGSSKGLSLSVSLFETNSRTFHRMQDCMVHIQKGEEQPIRYEDALLVAEQSRARTLGELMLRRRGPQLEHELMSPPSLFQMKAIVGRQSCPVVYLSYTGERLLGWLLYPTSDNQSSIVNMFEVPLSDNEFDGKSLDYHLRYSLNEQLVEKSFEMYKPFDYEKEKTEPLEKLYDLVARPVMRMLSTLDTKHSLQQGSAETFPVQHNRGKKKGGLRKIVVIPDSYTNLLPFTCVLNKDTGKFWGDDYYFQIMPSLLTMGILDQLPTVSVTIPVQYQQMLCVVGNPNIPRFKFNNEDWDLGKLPHATKEAEWVSHILQCKPILHEQATKDAVLMRIMNAKVIHLATHGSAVAGFLAFAGMTSSSSEAVDAKRVLIYPDEIESLNISPALVVLSSCDSGRGVFKADGIQGMARAFILAGAQAVLTALWRVPDESACIFMQFFYQYLVEGMRGTQALHKAILCLRCFSKYSQYIHWSGYQLTGREFQFSVSQSSSRAQLATRLGTSSVFPRLDILKNLETAFLNNPKLPTDVQVLHAPPGVKPSEPLVDFIHCHHTHFSGGIFWVNCRTPQLIEASLTAIKNCLRLKELSELPFLESHPTLVVLYYLDHFPKEDDSPLLSLLKHSSVHIVVVSKTAFPEQLQKSAHNQLIRGTNIINIKPLSTIHATQRLVHSALQNHHLTPSKTEQVLFEKLAEFTTGSPPIIDLTNSLLDLTLTRTDASASTEDALKDFASGVRLSELPQQKPLSVPREHLSSQPQEQFLRTPVRDVSRELYETIKKDSEEDVFITSAKYDSWQVVTVLIQHCDLTPEERLLLFCLSSFNCCPIPASYVTEIATIITKAAHQSHLASTLHNKLRDSKMLKVYPKPLIYHPNYPNSSTDEETDIDFVYIPRFISAAVWKDMMSDFDKVMALTTCYKALQISASQYQNLVGQSKQSTAENLQVLHLLGAASILVESFGQHFKLVGRLCFQQVYTIFVQLHRQPQPQVKSLDHL